MYKYLTGLLVVVIGLVLITSSGYADAAMSALGFSSVEQEYSGSELRQLCEESFEEGELEGMWRHHRQHHDNCPYEDSESEACPFSDNSQRRRRGRCH